MAKRYLKHLTSGRVYGYADLLVKTKKFVEISEFEASKIRPDIKVTSEAAPKKRTRKKKASSVTVEEASGGDSKSGLDEIFGDGADA